MAQHKKPRQPQHDSARSGAATHAVTAARQHTSGGAPAWRRYTCKHFYSFYRDASMVPYLQHAMLRPGDDTPSSDSMTAQQDSTPPSFAHCTRQHTPARRATRRAALGETAGALDGAASQAQNSENHPETGRFWAFAHKAELTSPCISLTLPCGQPGARRSARRSARRKTAKPRAAHPARKHSNARRRAPAQAPPRGNGPARAGDGR